MPAVIFSSLPRSERKLLFSDNLLDQYFLIEISKCYISRLRVAEMILIPDEQLCKENKHTRHDLSPLKPFVTCISNDHR